MSESYHMAVLEAIFAGQDIRDQTGSQDIKGNGSCKMGLYSDTQRIYGKMGLNSHVQNASAIKTGFLGLTTMKAGP